jgi:hypothetical protein
MKQITIVLGFTEQENFHSLLASIFFLPIVSRVIVVSPENPGGLPEKCEWLEGIAPTAGPVLNRLLAIVDTPYLLFVQPPADIAPGPYCLERFVEVAATTRAGLVYSDFEEQFPVFVWFALGILLIDFVFLLNNRLQMLFG